MVPLFIGSKDELINIITLCNNCHHFAPNKNEDFDKYMESECNGTFTTLLKAWEKVREEHPELIISINNNTPLMKG